MVEVAINKTLYLVKYLTGQGKSRDCFTNTIVIKSFNLSVNEPPSSSPGFTPGFMAAKLLEMLHLVIFSGSGHSKPHRISKSHHLFKVSVILLIGEFPWGSPSRFIYPSTFTCTFTCRWESNYRLQTCKLLLLFC